MILTASSSVIARIPVSLAWPRGSVIVLAAFSKTSARR